MNAFELYLDGKLIAERTTSTAATYQYAAVELEAGKRYPIRLDFHAFVNDAAIQPGLVAAGLFEGARTLSTPRARPTPSCW